MRSEPAAEPTAARRDRAGQWLAIVGLVLGVGAGALAVLAWLGAWPGQAPGAGGDAFAAWSFTGSSIVGFAVLAIAKGKGKLIVAAFVLELIAVIGMMAAARSSAGDAEGGWHGEVRDSAGVTLVINPDVGTWTAAQAWVIEQDLVIGSIDGPEAAQFGMIRGLAVSGSGEIVVMDALAGELRVFDASGAFMRRIGRRGTGPGEFGRAVTSVMIGAGDTVYVPDATNARVTRFLLSGESRGELPYPMAPGTPIQWTILGPEHLVYRTYAADADELMRLRLHPAALAGDTIMRAGHVDTLAVLDYPRMDRGPRASIGDIAAGTARIREDPFTPQPTWVVLRDGRVAISHSGTSRIAIHNADGSLDRIVYGPGPRLALTAEDGSIVRQKIEERTRARAPSPELVASVMAMIEVIVPDSMPAHTNLVAGPDETLLMQRPAAVAEMDPAGFGNLWYDLLGGREWVVLDREGRYLGDILLPPRLAQVITRGDHLYGVAHGDMGEDRIVRFRIDRSAR